IARCLAVKERLTEGVARGPLDVRTSGDGKVDPNLIVKLDGCYQYLRGDGYPKHFPLDEHLFPFIQHFTSSDPDADDATLIRERVQLERAILVGRDSLLGTCTFSYLSFPPNCPDSIQFPDVGQLGFFSSITDSIARTSTVVPATWEIHGQPKSGFSFSGLSLSPSGREYAPEDYSQLCLLDRILSDSAPSWYDGWSVTSSHRFRLGATEWLMGILHHYCDLLEHVGIRHAVTAALYSYPCHAGLLQALTERFNRRFNTFVTAEGETSLDLWAFHRISGLPICGGLYEEVCLDDLHRNGSTGTGSYLTPYSLRYLTKVWRDLACVGREQAPSACKSTVRVSFNAWISFFYNGPFCFHNSFAGDTTAWSVYYQLLVEQEEKDRFLPASKDRGWNPRNLPDRTYLAAYLAYWLSTFVVPYGEDGYIRPEVLYPACVLADGRRLALAPAALANIFHGLGNLTASLVPRDRAVGTAVILEPYYPHRFARNFGYDQAVPLNADFPLQARLYRGSDRHLVAASWWCYYIRRGPSPACVIPGAERSASYISEPIKKKPSSPRPKKRRAVKTGGASKRVAREDAIEDPLPEEPAPSDAIVEDADFGAHNDEGIGDMETDDYHSVRDGAPSSGEEDIPAAGDLGRGDFETDNGVGETPIGSDDQDDFLSYDENMSASFQELHNLLEIEEDPGLPEYQEGTATGVHDTDWTEILQNASAEISGFPTLEEGELPRGVMSGENGSALTGADPTYPGERPVFEGRVDPPCDRPGGELTASIPSEGTIVEDVPPADGVVLRLPTPGAGIDVEISGTTCSAADQVDGQVIIGAVSTRDTSCPSGLAQDGVHSALTVSQDTAPSIMAEGKAIFIRRFSLPPHGIVWPDDTQTGSARGLDFMAESFIRSIRSIIEVEFPPPIGEVRDRMKTSTKAYHLMGLPRDPWMASIDSLWAEV
ncbi:hypothetical protein Taro_007391, partial [Colocasia esculenta]|nr:hypothetical protein [Colocasia esculenta]